MDGEWQSPALAVLGFYPRPLGRFEERPRFLARFFFTCLGDTIWRQVNVATAGWGFAEDSR